MKLSKAWVLTIPGEFRGERLERELAEQAISVQIVEGVDGRNLTNEEFDRVYSARACRLLSGRELAREEVACVLGHQRLMSALVESGHPWGLMFEDDATLLGNLNFLESLLPKLNHKAAIVNLGLGTPPESLSSRRFQISDGALTLWQRRKAPYGAWGYAISRQAALVALSKYAHRRVDSQADWPAGWVNRVEFWECEPPLVAHPDEHERTSVIAVGREQAFRINYRDVRGWTRVLHFVTRYTGAQILYGMFLGVPPQDTFRATVLSPLVEQVIRFKKRVSGATS